tara:strand:+ start:223 stop:396 length:174 start_codon:yes stop_codon:yes gene_type:complete
MYINRLFELYSGFRNSKMTTIAETAAETIIQKEWTLFGLDKKRPNLLFFPFILIIIF